MILQSTVMRGLACSVGPYIGGRGLTEWLPTADIAWADGLSRATDRADSTLGKLFFTTLDITYSPHAVDRFGSLNNAQLPRYNSAEMNLGTEAVNALRQDWAMNNNWVNPPFASIPLIPRHLATQHASATVVVPVSRAQALWKPALEQADEICCVLRFAGICLAGVGTASGQPPHWWLCALRLAHRGRPPPPSPGHEPPAPSMTRVWDWPRLWYCRGSAEPLPRRLDQSGVRKQMAHDCVLLPGELL